MSHSRTVKAVLLFLPVAIVFLAAPPPLAAAPPNIVVVMPDDMGYGNLSSFGHPTIRTPHLDRLAEQENYEAYDVPPVRGEEETERP